MLKWRLGRIEKFPRSHRYGLRHRIETTLYVIFEELVAACDAPAGVKAAQLAEGNLHAGDTYWHGEGMWDEEIRSVKIAFYPEPLTAATGRLEIRAAIFLRVAEATLFIK
jgi:hypothetical protein